MVVVSQAVLLTVAELDTGGEEQDWRGMLVKRQKWWYNATLIASDHDRVWTVCGYIPWMKCVARGDERVQVTVIRNPVPYSVIKI